MVIEQDLMLQTKTLKRDGMDGGGEEAGEGRQMWKKQSFHLTW